MHFNFLASLALLPVGLTLGAAIGPEHRAVEVRSADGVETSQWCSKEDFFTPQKRGHRYTFATNAWGWEEGQPGSLCMKVSKFANGTYATKKAAPPFSITWQYPKGPLDQPVHAFPRVNLNEHAKHVPSTIGSLKALHLNVEWSYGIGSYPVSTASTDMKVLSSAGVRTNVALDMFADYDMNTALSTSGAHYEIMIWLAMMGDAAPIGYPDVVATRTVGGTTFNLYTGTNFAGQEVLTWLAKTPATDFRGNLQPLLHDLGPSGPSADVYLGSVSFGTEAFDTPQPVTFNVPKLVMSLHPY